jgi:hypothetical protein
MSESFVLDSFKSELTYSARCMTLLVNGRSPMMSYCVNRKRLRARLCMVGTRSVDFYWPVGGYPASSSCVGLFALLYYKSLKIHRRPVYNWMKSLSSHSEWRQPQTFADIVALVVFAKHANSLHSHVGSSIALSASPLPGTDTWVRELEPWMPAFLVEYTLQVAN